MSISKNLLNEKKIKIKKKISISELAIKYRENELRLRKEKKDRIYRERFELLNEYANDKEHYIDNLDEFLEGIHPLDYYLFDSYFKREVEKQKEKKKLINRAYQLEEIITKNVEKEFYQKINSGTTDDYYYYNFYYNNEFFLNYYDYLKIEDEVKEILKDEFQEKYFDPYE